MKSRVKKVTLVGRRGPLQVAFTIKEFREMLKLPAVSTNFFKGQMNTVENVIGGKKVFFFYNIYYHNNNIIIDLSRPRKRLMQLMYDTSKKPESPGDKSFDILFYRTPISLLGSDKIEGIELAINHLEGVYYCNDCCSILVIIQS